MGRKATTPNEREMRDLLRAKCTNFELKREMMYSFIRHKGNLREVVGDLIDIIQVLYMKKTELEFHLSPQKGAFDGEGIENSR